MVDRDYLVESIKRNFEEKDLRSHEIENNRRKGNDILGRYTKIPRLGMHITVFWATDLLVLCEIINVCIQFEVE